MVTPRPTVSSTMFTFTWFVERKTAKRGRAQVPSTFRRILMRRLKRSHHLIFSVQGCGEPGCPGLPEMLYPIWGILNCSHLFGYLCFRPLARHAMRDTVARATSTAHTAARLQVARPRAPLASVCLSGWTCKTAREGTAAQRGGATPATLPGAWTTAKADEEYGGCLGFSMITRLQRARRAKLATAAAVKDGMSSATRSLAPN
mmetsp:Transcript_1375/g.4217  ORF Transcript_1375/g.4217 Transcript_1375/m.4217 type:complete len:203 (+) Transcript_1375:330-938(+)